MKPLSECFLYTFVDSAYLHGRNPAEICRQLCEGGSDLIQFRAKDWPPERIEATARELVAITGEHNVGLVINDHPEIARRVGADFCHLGQEDFFDAGHRHSSEFPGLRLGLSTHSPEQARRALAAEPAYIAIGPVFPTGTKPSAKPVTLKYVRWASENLTIPWFAIGGIALNTLAQVLEAGAMRTCVVSAILNAVDARNDCAEIKRELVRIREPKVENRKLENPMDWK
jgi:thiamine-phosphate pyrophosphorylase